MRRPVSITVTACILFASVLAHVSAQDPPAPTPAPAPPAGGRGGGRGQAPADGQAGRGRGPATFPAQQRPAGDPALIARGRGLYDVNCRACHGADLRGGDMGGPNLLRSQLVLNDQKGELIQPVVQSGRQTPGMSAMPPFQLPADDIRALAEYIHSVVASMRGQGNPPPNAAPVVLNVLVGNATAGQAYFSAKCSSCHSATGDLAGVGSRISDPMQLQNFWVAGGGGGGRGGRGGAAGGASNTPTPVTATVVLPSGQKFEGPIVRYDDFVITITQPDGAARSFRRNGDVPKVEIKDPKDAHRKLWPTLDDKDIYDVTAYLVTLK